MTKMKLNRSVSKIEDILNKDQNTKNIFRYDELENTPTIKKDIKLINQTFKKGNITDHFISQLISYIERNYSLVNSDKLMKSAIVNVSRDNPYNPIKEYMNDVERNFSISNLNSHEKDISVSWNTVFNDFLGVEDNETSQLITNIFFMGSVALILEDNFKFDYVLDLVGSQGVGKTTILKKLSNGWYSSDISDFESLPNYLSMSKAFIVNDDEMTASNKVPSSQLKKFITLDTFEFKLPFDKFLTQVPKRIVLTRTTNDVNYLNDKTGNRRFLPLLVNKEKAKYNAVNDLTKNIVKLIWKGAIDHYRYLKSNSDNIKIFNSYFDLSPENTYLLEENIKNFTYIDELEELIDEYIEEHPNKDFITNDELASSIFHEPTLVKKPNESRRIKYIIQNKKDWRYGRKKINGKDFRGYLKI